MLLTGAKYFQCNFYVSVDPTQLVMALQTVFDSILSTEKPMIVVTISAVLYLCLIVSALALLWKSTNRLTDSRILKYQIQKSVNAARISERRKQTSGHLR
jgi:hypothetical protein